jgi:hypothetical protein
VYLLIWVIILIKQIFIYICHVPGTMLGTEGDAVAFLEFAFY